MSDLVKKIKIKKQDGTFTDYIPIGAEAQNIETNDGESVEVKLNKKPYYYNTVADMIADTKLKIGDMAVTLGYYEANDGGHGEYRIVSGTYTDDGGSYHQLDNNLYAELIVKNNEINIKQFGAKGDGTTDDINFIQNAINYCKANQVKTLAIPEGEYVISSGIIIDFSDFMLKGTRNSILKYVGNGTSGNLIYIHGTNSTNYIKNIKIIDINIDATGQVFKGGASMSTPAVTSPTPAYQGLRGIFVNFVINFTIENINMIDLYGDGIRLQKCHSGFVNNCYLRDVGGGNIVGGGPTGYDNFGDGIVAFSCFNMRITNNTVINTRTYLTTTANGYICGRSGLEFEYGLTTDNTNTPENNLFSFTDGHALIFDNNYVYGYTKGIHLEAGSTACHISNNSVIHCNIGVMNTISGKTSFVGNYFNSDNVGPAYQSGYNLHYGGIAISEYTNEDPTRTNVIVTNNIFDGDSNGVIIGRSHVTVANNTFRCTGERGAVHNNVLDLDNIVINSNQFYECMIHLYHTKGAVVSNNNCLNSNIRFILIEECSNTIIKNNITNNRVTLTSTCNNSSIISNLFLSNSDITLDQFINFYNGDNLIVKDNIVDLTNNNSAPFLEVSTVNGFVFQNNKFKVASSRTEPINLLKSSITSGIIKDNNVKGNSPLLYFIRSAWDLLNMTIENNVMENPVSYILYQTAGGIHDKATIQNNKGMFRFINNPNNSLDRIKNRFVNNGDVIYRFVPTSTSYGWVCTSTGYYVTDSWSSSTSYSLNKLILSNGYVYKCTKAGTSTVQPSSTTLGEVEDTGDGLNWLCCGTVATFTELTF